MHGQNQIKNVSKCYSSLALNRAKTVTCSVHAECRMSEVKSRALLERGNEKQEVVGELYLLVSSVETKPNSSLK